MATCSNCGARVDDGEEHLLTFEAAALPRAGVRDRADRVVIPAPASRWSCDPDRARWWKKLTPEQREAVSAGGGTSIGTIIATDWWTNGRWW